jgi:Flp pilus assembly protein TadG
MPGSVRNSLAHSRRKAAKLRQRGNNRRGAAATELALTLPLLLLLAFGCVELGRAVSIYSMVCSAARAGAEYGATHGYNSYTYASWQTQVQQQMTTAPQGNPTFDSTKFSSSINTTAEPGGFNLTTVTANYQFKTITQWPGLPNQFTISHTVAMRRYR